jgi:hypothetical protein
MKFADADAGLMKKWCISANQPGWVRPIERWAIGNVSDYGSATGRPNPSGNACESEPRWRSSCHSSSSWGASCEDGRIDGHS